jgi:Family of unknown function (DUF6159)
MPPTTPGPAIPEATPVATAASTASAAPVKIGRFKASKLIVQQSWAVLKQDKEIMWFPVMSSITTLIAIALMGALFFFVVMGASLQGFDSNQMAADSYGQQSNSVHDALGYVLLLVYYIVVFFIANFFQAGLLTIVQGRFTGQNLGLKDGMAAAKSHAGKIFLWSLLSATVGVILRAIADRSKIIGMIVASILGAAWNIMTYFSLPSLIIGNASIKDSFKQSAAIIRKTWGEAIIMNFGVGLFFTLIAFLSFALSIGLVIIFQSTVAAVTIGIIFVIAMILMSIISSTLGTIFKLALYNYANTGQIPTAFSPELVIGAVKVKK